MSSYGDASTFTYVILPRIFKNHVQTDTGLLYVELSNCLDKYLRIKLNGSFGVYEILNMVSS